MLPPKATARARVLNALAVLAETALAFLFFAVLIPLHEGQAALLPVMVPALWIPAAFVYWVVASRWIRPARQYLKTPPPPGEREEAQRAARRALVLHPVRTLILRVALWSAVGVAATVWLNLASGFPLRTSAIIAFALGIPGVLAGTFHAMWLREAARPVLAEIDPRTEPTQSYVESLAHLLNISAAACGSLGALFAAVFYHYFLDFTVERMQTIWKLFPYFVLSLTATTSYFTYLVLRRPRRFLLQALRNDGEEAGRSLDATPLPPSQDVGDSFRFRTTTPVPPAPEMLRIQREAPQIHRHLQRVPYIIAGMTFTTWLIAVIAGVVHAANMWQVAVEDIGLILVVGIVISSAVAIYQIQWHRALVRPALRLISTRLRIRADQGARLLGMRGKIVLAYVVVAAFAVALSLVMSFVQLRRSNTQDIARRARARAESILERAHERAETSGTVLRPAELTAGLILGPEEWVFYRPETGAERWADGLRPTRLPPFSIDVRVGFGLASASKGALLDLRAAQLAGWFFPIPETGGVLGVLLPGYRASGLGSRILTSVVFFIMLLGICLGIVFLAAREIAIPIVRLSQEATRIEHGDLAFTIPVGEGDEIGRLAGALDRMREGLARQIAVIDELNASLEEKVRARTAELEQRTTELSSAYASLKETQAQLIHSEKMASLGQLAAGVAHEINNPLNALANSIDPLATAVHELVDPNATADAGAGASLDEARTEVRAMLRVMRSAATRAQRIITDLILFARRGDTAPTEVDLADGIRETLDLVGHRTRGLIEVDCSLDDIGPVTCFPGPLNQVFMNLVLNAVQAVEGRTEPRIRLTLRRETDAGTIVFTVSDNGPGIDADVMPRIFDPFFTTKPPGEGSGLGLSISHQIIEQHRGTIQVDSCPGKGATFTVRLPAHLPKEAGAANRSSAHESGSTRAEP